MGEGHAKVSSKSLAPARYRTAGSLRQRPFYSRGARAAGRAQWLRSKGYEPLRARHVFSRLQILLRRIVKLGGTSFTTEMEGPASIQELLRHANSRITLDVYTQAVNSNKRAAQSKVVRMMVSDLGQKGEEKYPQTVQ
jgi:integrase